MDRKVWLPSGGSLVIDRTEAMTVVDVNTGKFVGSGGNLEETVTKNNLEAAEEIVRQLRLRDIGGIIVIDFIDMVLESNRDLVVRRLLECLGRDRTKHQVAEVTSLGLVQMTRKRVGSGLVEVFSEPCEHCGGRGILVHSEPVDRGGSNDSGGGQGGRPARVGAGAARARTGRARLASGPPGRPPRRPPRSTARRRARPRPRSPPRRTPPRCARSSTGSTSTTPSTSPRPSTRHFADQAPRSRAASGRSRWPSGQRRRRRSRRGGAGGRGRAPCRVGAGGRPAGCRRAVAAVRGARRRLAGPAQARARRRPRRPAARGERPRSSKAC